MVPPLQTAVRKQICRSYHLKLYYFSDCGRLATHGPLARIYMAKLKRFVTEHIVTPDVGRELES